MLNSDSHKINAHLVNLDFLDTKKTTQYQRELSHFITNKLLPEIEGLFDSISVNSRQKVCIHKIILDLGILQESNWQSALITRLHHKLKKILYNTVSSTQYANVIELEPMKVTTPVKSSTIKNKDNFNQLLFFLMNGRLEHNESVNKLQIFEALVNNINKQQWQNLTKLITTDKNSCHRFINYFSDNFIDKLFASNIDIPSVSSIVNMLSPVEKNHTLFACWRSYFLNSVVIIISDSHTCFNSKNPVVKNILIVRKALLQMLNELSSINTDVSKPKNLTVPWSESLIEVDLEKLTIAETDPMLLLQRIIVAEQYVDISSIINYSGYQHSDFDLVSTTSNVNHISEDNHVENELPQEAAQTVIKNKSTVLSLYNTASSKINNLSTPNSTGICLPGVGVLLLHPFLTELFSSQKLLRGNEFLDRMSQQQALQMLRYLSFGESKVTEYDLYFSKLLCSMAWSDALLLENLSESHKIACDELLSALMKHWVALRSSSADWLRTQFFWRTGNLLEQDEYWILGIDSQAQDILLTKLPWGITTIRLPWMKKLLHVNWNH